MLTVVAFIVALAVLIAVHEYGHYRMAVACGVKVLRFSIGFGKTLFKWQPKNSPTEFVIAAFPLGGYVKMLDEREGPVAPEERHLAFNTQRLRSRALIVVAGPVANLLLAIVLYAVVSWIGVQEPAPVLAAPVAESIAAKAGFKGGETVTRMGSDQEHLSPVTSFEDIRWSLTRAALDGNDMVVEYHAKDSAELKTHVLPLSSMDVTEADAQLYRRIGLVGPWTAPVLGEITPDSPAVRAGLKQGDIIVNIGSSAISDGQQLREVIRAQFEGQSPLRAAWTVERNGVQRLVTVEPELKQENGQSVARIGAYVGSPPQMIEVRRGPLDGISNGVVRTWQVSVLTLKMMGRMLIGEASIKNLSGPLTIADYAGKSASLGLTQYLVFLALISVSLGVLNLLPLPVLDGGHLMYYLWEGVTGRSVSDAWMERLQRGGVAVLLVMMSVALFNDVTRLFS